MVVNKVNDPEAAKESDPIVRLFNPHYLPSHPLSPLDSDLSTLSALLLSKPPASTLAFSSSPSPCTDFPALL